MNDGKLKTYSTIRTQKIVKNLRDWCDGAQARILKFSGLIDFPVAPSTSRRRTGGISIRKYYESGLMTYLPIATTALQVEIDLLWARKSTQLQMWRRPTVSALCKDLPKSEVSRV